MLTMAIEKGQLFSRLLARCRHLTIGSLVSSSQFLSSPIVKFKALLNPDLSVPDHPEIFVVGDMGEVASDGKVLPQLGSVAMQSGEHVGRQIARRLQGEPGQPFKYWDKGFMATIGRGSAVVEFPNMRTLDGPLAYFAWLGVHLALLSGMRNRIETLWNWGWSALTHDRAARIIIDFRDDEVKHAP